MVISTKASVKMAYHHSFPRDFADIGY